MKQPQLGRKILELRKAKGPSALVVGALGVVNGILFVTVVFAVFGLLLLTLVELLQLLLLYKIRILLGEKIQNNKLAAEISNMQGSY